MGRLTRQVVPRANRLTGKPRRRTTHDAQSFKVHDVVPPFPTKNKEIIDHDNALKIYYAGLLQLKLIEKLEGTLEVLPLWPLWRPRPHIRAVAACPFLLGVHPLPD